MPFFIRTLGRAGHLVWISVCHILLPLLFSRQPTARARSLRIGLERLGSTFVKLGQALALRFDLLPSAYCEELLDTRAEYKPSPDSLIRRIVLEELGREPDEIFSSFDRKPFSVTSTGQLHRASDGHD